MVARGQFALANEMSVTGRCKSIFSALTGRVSNTTDTQIFSRELVRLRLCISKSYRGARCPICITVQDDTAPVHAKFTHRMRAMQENYLIYNLGISQHLS
jgi:hypothetical protein